MQSTVSGRSGRSGAAARCLVAAVNAEGFDLVAVLRRRPTLVLV